MEIMVIVNLNIIRNRLIVSLPPQPLALSLVSSGEQLQDPSQLQRAFVSLFQSPNRSNIDWRANSAFRRTGNGRIPEMTATSYVPKLKKKKKKTLNHNTAQREADDPSTAYPLCQSVFFRS